MSAAGALMLQQRDEERYYQNLMKLAYEDNYDLGIGFLEYPKVKHWKLIRRLLKI